LDLVKDSKPLKPTRKQESAEIADMRRRGLKLEEIATIKGVKKAAISRRLGRAGVEHSAIAQFREDKSLILEEKQKLLLEALDEKKVAAMSGKDLTISAAVLIDKQRLLDGHSASGGNISLLVIANRVHQEYQLGKLKGGDEHVIEAEVVSPTTETGEEVEHGEA
jgi:transcriptional regulator with XRE-family HTH domain